MESGGGRFPNGHYYSPVIDPAEVEQAAGRIWPSVPNTTGIDFRPDAQRSLLVDVFPRYIREYDYPDTLPAGNTDPHRYFDRNPAFAWLDSRALFVLLRAWRPGRLIEVGSGYSTLLMSDVNQRFLGGTMDLRCIEPYPLPMLDTLPAGVRELVRKPVQDVPLSFFDALSAGDVLFIDSSHVSKIGSDVNHLLFEVLPRLRAGVHIHFHDIFLPYDYPRDWVLKEGLYWNEQYVLRALLTLNSAFRVTFGSNFAATQLNEEVCTALSLTPGSLFAGGSFWIEKLV